VSRRTERIAEQLKSEIARILREEATDPRIRMVTLTRVDCAPDLSNALVYWSSMAADDESGVSEIEAGLDSAAAFIRRRLAQVLPLRRTPRLSFRHDASLAKGSEMLALLREISGDE
jgi:ribosome-binding factor A